jgi:hypothetical protein
VSDAFSRGYVAMLYMMNKRGEVLRDCIPDELSSDSALVLGLCDPDRNVRSKWLARCLRDIMSDLQARTVN